jgi:hypothetical protein
MASGKGTLNLGEFGVAGYIKRFATDATPR